MLINDIPEGQWNSRKFQPVVVGQRLSHVLRLNHLPCLPHHHKHVSQPGPWLLPNTTHSQYSFLGITSQNCSPRGGKTTISLSGNHSSVKFNFNPFISLKNPFKLSIHEMWSIISNISNNSRIKRMLPFKSSTLYKVEPRRDFVVRPKQVKHSRGSHVQKMNQFYDIEQNVPLV